jgi:hypothetical protein
MEVDTGQCAQGLQAYERTARARFYQRATPKYRHFGQSSANLNLPKKK